MSHVASAHLSKMEEAVKLINEEPDEKVRAFLNYAYSTLVLCFVNDTQRPIPEERFDAPFFLHVCTRMMTRSAAIANILAGTQSDFW